MNNKRNELTRIFQDLGYHKFASFSIDSGEQFHETLVNVVLRLAVKKSRNDLITEIYLKLII